MMGAIGTRIALHEDVIAFPATKGTAAITLKSDELNDFEQSAFGKVKLITGHADASKITDTIVINAYTSYNEGDSWHKFLAVTTMNNGSGAENNISSFYWLTPRVRVDAVFDGSAELAAGHGCYVDVELEELNPENIRTFKNNALVVDATKAGGDSGLTWANYGDSIDIGATRNPKTIYIGYTAADISKVTDTFVLKLQSSHDGEHYTDVDTLANTEPDNGSGTGWGTDEVNGDTVSTGRYFRLKLASGDTTAALAADHGIEYNMLVVTE